MVMHHPPLEMLLDYASGRLEEAASITVALHASMCSVCSDILATMDQAAAALVDEIEESELKESALEEVLSRLDDEKPDYGNLYKNLPDYGFAVPKTIQPYVSNSGILWSDVAKGIKRARLLGSHGKSRLDILSIAPCNKIPLHSHDGKECTVVMDGGFSDEQDHYGPGDFSFADAAVDHSPEADEGGCMCLIALDAPIRLVGPLGRFLNPLLKH